MATIAGAGSPRHSALIAAAAAWMTKKHVGTIQMDVGWSQTALPKRGQLAPPTLGKLLEAERTVRGERERGGEKGIEAVEALQESTTERQQQQSCVFVYVCSPSRQCSVSVCSRLTSSLAPCQPPPSSGPSQHRSLVPQSSSCQQTVKFPSEHHLLALSSDESSQKPTI